jgi:hypothetical protein
MSYTSEYLIFFSLFAAWVGNALGIYLSYKFFAKSSADVKACKGCDVKTMKGYEKSKFWATVLLAGLSVLLVCYSTCLCCLWSALRVAMNVIDAAADFLRDTKRTIVAPLVHFLMGVVVFILWLACFACVISMNDIKADKKISQFKSLTWTTKNTWLAIFMVFSIFWLLTCIENLSNMVIMVTASTYYFNNDESTSKSEAH